MSALGRSILGLTLGWLATRLVVVLARLHVLPAAAPARLATRRTFVRNAALGAVGVALAESAVGIGMFAWPQKRGAFGTVLPIAAADVPPVGERPFRSTAGHFYLARNEDGVLAMWWKYPHLGCTVPWVGPPESPAAYHCPCHGSMYDYSGVLTGGPSPRPLDLMQVTVDARGNVTANAGEVRTRTGYDKDQAVLYPASERGGDCRQVAGPPPGFGSADRMKPDSGDKRDATVSLLRVVDLGRIADSGYRSLLRPEVVGLWI